MKRPIKRQLLALPAAAILLAASVWAGGFAQFASAVRETTPPPPRADGIVVLTGGADRIEEALHLLGTGRAPLLLVSGVGRGADLAEVARRVQLAPGDLESRVTLGHNATSTLGNAIETAAWARDHDLHRLIVVTAGYHMPRALLELGRALPGVALYPAPVQPPAMRGNMDLHTVRLLAHEYDKLLAARFGLTQLAGPGV